MFFYRMMRVMVVLLAIAALSSCGTLAEDAWPLPQSVETKPGTYLWVPGSALDEAGIDYNLKKMDEAGFGTLHLIPIYGARGYEDRYIDFLSPQWMAMLDYFVTQARERGMEIDMTTGSGWNFGGPNLEDRHKDTRVEWQGAHKPLRFIRKRNVKRAAPGGGGSMIDPFSPEAMRHYLQRFSEAFDEYQPALPRNQYHDSYEYLGNWSEDLLEYFKQRRGYDLEPHLPIFFDKTTDRNREQKARLKYDYRRTLSEQHHATMKEWVTWSHERGMKTRNEAHGAPANLLDVYALADIPETEMFGSPEFAIPGFTRDTSQSRKPDHDRQTTKQIMKMASSAAHVAHSPGEQLVAAEAFTWLRNHWHGTLGHMKMSADLFFLGGVNHIFYHGTCYSPEDVPWPGWYFYASTKADWRNAIWHDIDQLNLYVSRSQAMLQAGRPAHDLLIYWPIHDLWMDAEGMQKDFNVHISEWMREQPMGDLAKRMDKLGYTHDFISDAMLDSLEVQGKKLIAKGGEYKAIVVPQSQYMPVSTARRLAELADAGATVIFERNLPRDVPGLHEVASQRTALGELVKQLENAAVVSENVSDTLAELKIAREPMVDMGLEFIRRQIDGEMWYFVANHSAKPVDEWLELAPLFKHVVAYDPMTGKQGTLAVRNSVQADQFYLQLKPGHSLILRAAQRGEGPAQWVYYEAAGEPITLEGPWQVEFIAGGPSLPEAYTTDELSTWTDAPDEKADAFAGTARYTTIFEYPADAADDWLLDLGNVHQSAEVRLNGELVGTLIAVPFEIQVGELLKPGKNTLEIDVTSLSANRIRAVDQSDQKWKIMRDINIVNHNYGRMRPADWPLTPAGLTSPVRLHPMKIKPVK